MIKVIRGLIEFALANPIFFEVQQKFCNNYKNVREEFIEHLRRHNINILDVGCSTGTSASKIFDMSTNNYYGVDISPEYIEIATKRYPEGKFFAMDARKMDFEDNFFDIVIFNGVLHHMDDQLIHACLLDIKRVMKPDGKLLVAEPLFTQGKVVSNMLLSLDRGRYIRDLDGYRDLLIEFNIERQGFFKLSLHRFCSFVAEPKF